MFQPLRQVSGLVVALFFLFLFLLYAGSGFYTDLLWFQNLGYAAVFWKLLASRWLIYLVVGLVWLLFLFSNLQLTKPTIGETLHNVRFLRRLAQLLTSKRVSTFFFAAPLVIAVMGSTASGKTSYRLLPLALPIRYLTWI